MVNRNKNPIAVKYILEHTNFIENIPFCMNPNEQAVLHYLKNKTFDDVLPEFFCNENDIAVSFLVSHYLKWNTNQMSIFSINKNKNAILFLIEHPQYIIWDRFSTHSDPEAISFMIKHHQRVNWSLVCNKDNEELLDFLLENTEYIDFPSFYTNSNKKAIDYIVKQNIFNNTYFLLSGNKSIFIPEENIKVIKFQTYNN